MLRKLNYFTVIIIKCKYYISNLKSARVDDI